MDLDKAKKFIGKKIEELEEQTYTFEYVLKPRFEEDKKILEALRSHQLKMIALQEKSRRGEDVTQEDIYSAVPKEFR